MAWVCRFIFRVTILLLGCHAPAFSQDMNLVVIANGKGVPSEMKMEQLKSVLKGEKLRWPDGSKVVIALLKSNTPIGVSTSKKIYNMSANELNKYWLALVFQGKADAPNFFNSEAELEEFVSQTTGAIGVVSQPPAGGKTVVVDGKRVL
ncbi:hypothetical protein [Hymenobacter sp. BT491]|uniref:hypothetical protein n=1 Tax=Hymenobacter sp. BT491 TaxID=2766779 RepID=UPI001653BE1A|nr:hypothetical protein [Hymenobacter sp. BT491]MBC6992361.1 hypothetical protein [Hymenobacter sp. BT491]